MEDTDPHRGRIAAQPGDERSCRGYSWGAAAERLILRPAKGEANREGLLRRIPSVSKTLDMGTKSSCPDKASRKFGRASRNFVPFGESRYLMFEPFSGQ